MNRKKAALLMVGILVAVTVAGMLLPEQLIIPVKGATGADWNAKTFWFRPWGKSGVHRGIDIFAKEGTPVLAACSGIVVFSGVLRDGGNVVALLGPKWRIHYYAHLQQAGVRTGTFVRQGTVIGMVGATGNAVGKPPHLHYAIMTQIPYPWRYKPERFGFDRIWYLDPNQLLKGTTALPRNAR